MLVASSFLLLTRLSPSSPLHIYSRSLVLVQLDVVHGIVLHVCPKAWYLSIYISYPISTYAATCMLSADGSKATGARLQHSSDHVTLKCQSKHCALC